MTLRNFPQDLELCFQLEEQNIENHAALVLFEPHEDNMAYAAVAWNPTLEQHILTEHKTDIFDIDHELESDPREYIFVIDRSGSMMGRRIESARDSLKLLIQQLPNENTYFDVLRYIVYI